jgi:hypothetical protein
LIEESLDSMKDGNLLLFVVIIGRIVLKEEDNEE